MKTKLLVLVFAIAFSSVSQAQDKNTLEPSSYSKDFGFNTTFIFQGIFQSQAAPFAIMYKHYIKENKALRLGTDISFFNNKNKSDVGSGNYQDNSSGNIDLAIGLEQQLVLGGKWTWYYGGDLVPTYSFNKSTAFVNNEKSNYNGSSNYGLGAKPFLGIRYNINSRLYVSAEASAQLTYFISKNLQKTYNPPDPEVTIRDLTTDNISFDINAASGVFIFYRF